ncbi:MAG: hypothetical protein CMP51_00435 [Flavobacteriales bacterium]|nr:hypothetical protein [Flavobacteriales bacterium]
MKFNYMLSLFIFFFGCNLSDENEIIISNNNCGGTICSEWEACTNVSNDFFGFDWQCRPYLWLYTNHGYWSGVLEISSDIGVVYTQTLNNLNAICADPNYYFSSSIWKYIILPFPLSEDEFYSNNSTYPDSEINYLDFEFTDQITLDFFVNDSIFDPFVQNNVIYVGEGQILNTNGSANAIIEFNGEFEFEGNNYFVTFNLSR